MKNFFTIIKKELYRFFTDRRLVLSLFLPGLFIYAFYSIFGSILPSITGQSIKDDQIFYISCVDKDNTPDSFLTYVETTITSQKQYKVYFVDVSTSTEKINDAKEKIKNGEYHLLIDFDDNFEDKISQIKKGETVEAPKVEFYYNSQNVVSTLTYNIAKKVLTLPQYNVTTFVDNFDNSDLGNSGETASKIFASLLPFIVISLLYSSCISICPESIAGEKERGTIATLLITPIKPSELALGKISSLTIISSIGAITSFLGVTLSLPKIMSMSGITISFGALQYVLMFLLLFSCVTFIASIMCLLSALAKTVKEANSFLAFLMPLMMVLSLLSSFLPSDSIWLALIPIYNISMGLSQLVTNVYNAGFLSLTIVSTFIYSFLFVFLIVRAFKSEKIMFSR